MSSEISTLSHVGINEFGKWAKVMVESHPEVQIKIVPDIDGYNELKLKTRPPIKCKQTECCGLVDTGAQMVSMGLQTVYAMGLGRKHIVPVGMKIKAANTDGLRLLGGVLVKISGFDNEGQEHFTRQLAYVAEEVQRVFLSKKASEELGIIGKNFPTIGAYALEDEEFDELTKLNKNNDEINYFKACEGLSTGKCSCPKRELPPKAPDTCPFPPTLENIERLEMWIRSKYRASMFNTCSNQALPLMNSSPPLELFIDKSV